MSRNFEDLRVVVCLDQDTSRSFVVDLDMVFSRRQPDDFLFFFTDVQNREAHENPGAATV